MNSSDIKKYYEIFNLQETASISEIRRAYRKLAFKYHPDRNSDPKAHQVFIDLTSAYEKIIEAKNEPEKAIYSTQTHPNSKRKAKSRSQDEAQQKYEQQQYVRFMQEEKYFQKLTTGLRWKLYTWFMRISFVVAVILLIEPVLPKHYETDAVVSFSNFYNGIEELSVRCIKTESGKKIWVSNPTVRMLHDNHDIQIESSFVFRNPRRVWYIDLYDTLSYPVDFSAINLYPVVPILFLIPFFVFLYKQKNYIFTIGYIFSVYFVGASLIWFLFTQDRWFHLLTFGLI
jgi:hypothetical protein